MKPSRVVIWFQFFAFFLPSVEHAHAQTWQLAPGTFGNGAGAIAIYPQNPDTMFALGLYWTLRSVNGGMSWDSISDFGYYQGGLAVNPSDLRELLCIAGGASGGTRLFRSSNSGVDWSYVFDGYDFPSNIIEHDPVDPQKVYVGLGPSRIRSSTDFGVTWDTLTSPTQGIFLTSLSISRTAPNVFLAGMLSAIMKSTDAGKSWISASPGLSFGNGSIVEIDPNNENIFYAGIYSVGSTQGGMYKSTNGGTTWFEINNGLTDSSWEVKKLLINPKNPNEIFVGLRVRFAHNSLFRSTDAGQSWHPFDLGLPTVGDLAGITSITLDTLNQRLFVGHATSSPGDSIGIYYLDLVTGVGTAGVGQPSPFALYQNYPNPFNASTTIHYSLQVADRVNLKVYDLLGREVGILVSGVAESGNHVVTFDGSGLASGLYFYRLEAGGFVRTRKLLLLR